jgi:transcriptional regulator with XRE-family HTH domain
MLAHDREIAKRIKARRLDLRMSQQALGRAIGLTFQQVQKYEKGVNRVGAGRLQQIAKILKVSPTYFFDDVTRLNGGEELFSLLDTSYSLRIVKAFARISDPRLRQNAVELIESIAEATDQSRR